MASAFAEVVDLALGRPLSVAAITLLGIAGPLVAILSSQTAGIIVTCVLAIAFVAAFLYSLRQRTLYDGPFVVLEDEITWDLTAADGSEAVVTKNRLVRFNYPMIAYAESTWGEGEHVADLDCEYGRLLDTVQDGSEHYAIVAFEAEKQRGEEARLVSHRTVRNGFLEPSEWVELRIQHRSHKQVFSIRFPEERHPRNLTYRKESDGKNLSADDQTLVAEGRRKVFRLADRAPAVGDKLRVRWDW